MTIKSEEDKKWCNRTKQWFKKYAEDIGAYFMAALIVGLLIWMFGALFGWLTSDSGKALAKHLVKKDYPAVMCLSGNGQFRIYEANTYTVHKHEVNGWNIYWTKQGSTDSSAFHLGKCEIK
ncbi:MAG: hypothetical protein DRH57_04810 [Candidatus Cloacimonadota bacterium]|nr:MAG: hypothetical protein DRH57_04810 [Candidatus Cloacimonadota bacterium]